MSDEQTGIGAKPPVAAVGEIDEIGIGMLGYAFMGKAHSNAFRKIQYMTWPPPLMPRLVAIAGETTVAPHGATFEDGYRAAEVCDAILRSAESGQKERISYR